MVLKSYPAYNDELNALLQEYLFRLVFFTEDGRAFTLYTDDAFERLSPDCLWLTGNQEKEGCPALLIIVEDFADDFAAQLAQICTFFGGNEKDPVYLYLESSDIALEFNAQKRYLALVSPSDTLVKIDESDVAADPISCWDELIDTLLGSA